ncbi:MAG: HEAT repeat domain-containing protein [Planctomycetota bacterium]|nr:HEAT repeat domain-containing protein [Planctomycetota bacterium]
MSELIDILKTGAYLEKLRAIPSLGARGTKAEKAIPELVILIKKGELVQDSAMALAQIGQKSLPELVQLLNVKSPYAREMVVCALGEMGPLVNKAFPDLIKALVRAVKEDKESLWKRIGKTIVKMGPGAIPKLINVMKDKKSPARYMAAAVIGDMGVGVLEPLTKLIKGDDKDLRFLAAVGLKGLGPLAAKLTPDLIEMIGEKDENSRIAAIQALEKIGPKAEAAVPTLIKIAKNPSAELRHVAISALGGIGSPAEKVIPVLTDLLDDKDEDFLYGVIFVLGKFGPRAANAVPKLLQLLKNEDLDCDEIIADTLAKIGPKARAAVPMILKEMNDEDSIFSEAGIRTLGKIGAGVKGVVPALLKELKGPDEYRRWEAAEALGNIGPKAKVAVPALIAALNSEDRLLRTNSAKALGKIGVRDEKVMNALIEASKDKKNLSLQVVVVEALGQLWAHSNSDTVFSVLKRLQKDADPYVREKATELLKKLSPIAQKKALEDVAKIKKLGVRHSYKFSVNTTLKIKSGNQLITVDSPNSFQYDNYKSKDGLVVQLNEIVNNLIINGAESLHMVLNKNGEITRQGGQTQFQTYQESNAKVKKRLDSLFRTHFAKITLDKEGKERTRKVTVAGEYGEHLDATIDNVRWFHPYFPAKNRWGAFRTFDIGNGGKLDAYFSYKRLGEKDAAGNSVIEVSADVSKDVISTNRGKLHKATYRISGVQSYDEKQKLWVSGKTKVTFSYTLNGVFMQGTMTLVLSKLAGPVKLTSMRPKAEKKLPDLKLDPATLSKYSYQMSIDSDVTTMVNGQALKFVIPVKLRYENSVGAKAVIVKLKDFKYQVNGNGRTNLYVEMDKDHIGFHNGGKKQIVPVAEADPKNKALLHNLFNVPFAQMTVDEEGKELTRKVNKKSEGGKAYDVTIHNVRWFHARFAASKNWVEKRTFDVTKGGTVSGDLTFTKLDEKDSLGHTVVKVTGVMTQDKTVSLRAELRKLKLSFVGKQSYDEKRKIWVSGQSQVQLSYQLVTPQGVFGTTGTMTLKLKLDK